MYISLYVFQGSGFLAPPPGGWYTLGFTGPPPGGTVYPWIFNMWVVLKAVQYQTSVKYLSISACESHVVTYIQLAEWYKMF